MNAKLIKGLGVGASVAGVVLSLFTGWIGDKQQAQMIKEEVQKAVANLK